MKKFIIRYYCLIWAIFEMIISLYHTFQGDYLLSTHFLVWTLIALYLWKINIDITDKNPFA